MSRYWDSLTNYSQPETGKLKKNARETVIQMLRKGKLSVEEIVQYVPSLSIEDVEKIQQELL